MLCVLFIMHIQLQSGWFFCLLVVLKKQKDVQHKSPELFYGISSVIRLISQSSVRFLYLAGEAGSNNKTIEMVMTK
jgi:hypothetical protein